MRMALRAAAMACAAGLALAAANAREEEPRWVDYEPAVVTLSGRLVEKEPFGPPDFGEDPDTDMRAVRQLLVLDEPLNVRGAPGSDFNADDARGVREVQLEWRAKPAAVLGRRARVQGTLRHGIAPLDFTEVLLAVAHIELLE